MSGLAKRVLAVGAHPDDVDLYCAGTLAKFLRAGTAVEVAVVCRGDKGGGELAADELAARRERESRQSAGILGVPIHFLGVGDAEVRDTPEIRRQVTELLRRAQAELVLTHSPDDYHDDHVQVSQLVLKCSWYAASPGHRTDSPPLAAPATVMFTDHLAGIGFEPTHCVDITETIEIKRQMLSCHGSQTARADSGMDQLLELSETLSRLRGFQCGVLHAEAFRPAPAFARRRAEPIFP